MHLWGCFSKQGFGILYLFTCNLNAEKMLEIYKKALLPSAERWFVDKNEDWILQKDNDPKHRSKLCTEWKQQCGIVTLDWLSQSPDANPIENVWAYEVCSKSIANFEFPRVTYIRFFCGVMLVSCLSLMPTSSAILNVQLIFDSCFACT